MNLRHPDPGGIFRGAARSVIRIVSDTESGKLLPLTDPPSERSFVRHIRVIPRARHDEMLTRFAIPRLPVEKPPIKRDRRCYYKTLVN